MNISSKIVKALTYPLWTVRDKSFMLYRYIYKYRNYNSYSQRTLVKYQFTSLQKLLKHAYNHTEYYKKLFDSCDVKLSDIHNDHNLLKNLPLLSKKIIMENQDKLIARNFDKKDLLPTSTGGSTGVPLNFYRDKQCVFKRKAQELFFDKWMGCDIGDKVALFVASRHSPKGLKGFKSRIRNATSDRILAFDPSRINIAYMEAFFLELRKFKPKIIKCFPNSLYIFAKFLKNKGVDDFNINVISCTGETLHDYQRKLFEEVFKCQVFEKYGTFESGIIACECSQHEGMHIFLDGAFIEFVNDKSGVANPGELANIVVTDLFNFGMPFIRYKIGDVGIYTSDRCRCGSQLPMIKKLCGRDRDILVDNNGNPKPGYLFVEIFNKNRIPGQFQVIQNDFNVVNINIVKMSTLR